MAVLGLLALLSSATCYLTTPIMYNVHGTLSLPLWIAFLFCAFATLCAYSTVALTRYGEVHGLINVCQLCYVNIETRAGCKS